MSVAADETAIILKELDITREEAERAVQLAYPVESTEPAPVVVPTSETTKTAVDEIIVVNHGYDSDNQEEQDALNSDVDALLSDENLDAYSIRMLMETAFVAGFEAAQRQ